MAKVREHGTRAKYVVESCHCDACRLANTEYQRRRMERRAGGDLLVDPANARERIRQLRENQIGQRQIALQAQVARSVIRKIELGLVDKIQASTEASILGVLVDVEVSAADGAYVDARRTWVRIDRLLDQGFSKAWISQQIGHGRALQLFHHSVTARNARAIEALSRKVGDATPDRYDPVDAAPARAHIEALRQQELSDADIAALAVVDEKLIRGIRLGNLTHIWRNYEPWILDISSDPEVSAPDTALIDATRTRRRVARWETLGYAPQWIRRNLGTQTLDFVDNRVQADVARRSVQLAARIGLTRAKTWELVDANDAQSKLTYLFDQGVTDRRLANRVYGASPETVKAIRTGEKPLIRPDLYLSIEDLPLEPALLAGDRDLIDGIATADRVDDLFERGYSRAEIAKLVHAHDVAQLYEAQVTAGVARDVIRLMEKLADQAGPELGFVSVDPVRNQILELTKARITDARMAELANANREQIRAIRQRDVARIDPAIASGLMAISLDPEISAADADMVFGDKTRARLGQLEVLGYPTEDIAEAFGERASSLTDLFVSAGLARRVIVLLDEANDTPRAQNDVLPPIVRPERVERVRTRPARPARSELATIADENLIDASPTQKRLLHLVALKYPEVWIARQVGLKDPSAFHEPSISEDLARSVKLVADVIGDTPAHEMTQKLKTITRKSPGGAVEAVRAVLTDLAKSGEHGYNARRNAARSIGQALNDQREALVGYLRDNKTDATKLAHELWEAGVGEMVGRVLPVDMRHQLAQPRDGLTIGIALR